MLFPKDKIPFCLSLQRIHRSLGLCRVVFFRVAQKPDWIELAIDFARTCKSFYGNYKNKAQMKDVHSASTNLIKFGQTIKYKAVQNMQMLLIYYWIWPQKHQHPDTSWEGLTFPYMSCLKADMTGSQDVCSRFSWNCLFSCAPFHVWSSKWRSQKCENVTFSTTFLEHKKSTSLDVFDKQFLLADC